MKLYLMRHCATDEGPQMDADRQLDDVGRAQAKTMRRFLKRAMVKPDLIISSDFARAQQTAEEMQRGDTPLKTTPWLRPCIAPTDADVSGAWNSILALAKDAKAILVVTHGPLIQRLLASVGFCFIDESWQFEHGAIAYVNTDQSRFRWYVSPKLAAHIVGDDPKDVENVAEAGEIFARLVRLSENLMAEARQAVIKPLRDQMRTAVDARWKRQLRRARKALRGHTAIDSTSTAAVLATVLPFADKQFAKQHAAIKSAAYSAGVSHTASQLGIDVNGAVQGIEGLREAQPKRPIKLPAPDKDSINDQGYDLERELDRTTVDRTSNALKGISDTFTVAAALATLNGLFDGFTNPQTDTLSRADTVALQTVSDGYHAGGKDLASEAVGAGMDIEKRWDLGGEGCPICEANSDEGWIDNDEPHGSGDFEPPSHPNCDCAEGYRLAEGE